MKEIPVGLKSNLHAHTTFDDGTLSAERMVEAAFQKGFESFGLSGHSVLSFENDWSMTPEGEKAFKAEMARLKAVYKDRMTVFSGIEQDGSSPQPAEGADYVIGSAHFILKDGEALAVDDTMEIQRGAVERLYGGDYYAYIRDYYTGVVQMAGKVRPDIVGHFDLVTKFNEGGALFDEEDRRYKNAALEAMTAVLETNRLFEINTGAMYRVGRTRPYLSAFLLKALCERGGEIILSSDSHDDVSIGWRFAEAAELAKSCGFKAAKKLTADGFVDVAL